MTSGTQGPQQPRPRRRIDQLLNGLTQLLFEVGHHKPLSRPPFFCDLVSTLPTDGAFTVAFTCDAPRSPPGQGRQAGTGTFL
jgi:hypothetical protein